MLLFTFAIICILAQCIYTASENNTDAAYLLGSKCNMASLDSTVQQTDDSTEFVLLRTLVTGEY